MNIFEVNILELEFVKEVFYSQVLVKNNSEKKLTTSSDDELDFFSVIWIFF